ncbi:MAG: hypothetical protein BWY72_01609 [Bacteroidetes bacterium ADurb.Bin416]|nr:MAG: hypothetical protein BWY72_01609 [Bacteroidetes bacterium ADurb.Bin416]
MGCRHIGTPYGLVYFIGYHHGHLSIDAGTRVPPAVVIGGIHMNGNDIVGTSFYVVGNIQVESAVPVIPGSGALTVHIHRRRGHDTVKFQIDCFVCHIGRYKEGFPIPSFAPPGEFTGTTVSLFIERTCDGPVVWNGYGLPGGVVITRLLVIGTVTFVKLPPVVEIGPFGSCHTGCAQEDSNQHQPIDSQVFHRA